MDAVGVADESADGPRCAPGLLIFARVEGRNELSQQPLEDRVVVEGCRESVDCLLHQEQRRIVLEKGHRVADFVAHFDATSEALQVGEVVALGVQEMEQTEERVFVGADWCCGEQETGRRRDGYGCEALVPVRGRRCRQPVGLVDDEDLALVRRLVTVEPLMGVHVDPAIVEALHSELLVEFVLPLAD